MSSMDMVFGKLGTFSKKTLTSRTFIKWFYFISVSILVISLILGIILLACKPQFYLIQEGKDFHASIGFWNATIKNFHLISESRASYATYTASNSLSASGIAFIVLASISEVMIIISFLLVRYLKSHNTIYYHIFSFWFTILFSSMYIIIMVIGLIDKVHSQEEIYYQLNLNYKFNFIFSFNLIQLDGNKFGLNFTWIMGGIAFIGFMSSLLFVLVIFFVVFSTKMLFRKPHYRYQQYYDIVDYDKEKRGIFSRKR